MPKKHLTEARQTIAIFLASIDKNLYDKYTERDVANATYHLADLFREVDKEMHEQSKLKEVAIFQ